MKTYERYEHWKELSYNCSLTNLILSCARYIMPYWPMSIFVSTCNTTTWSENAFQHVLYSGRCILTINVVFNLNLSCGIFSPRWIFLAKPNQIKVCGSCLLKILTQTKGKCYFSELELMFRLDLPLKLILAELYRWFYLYIL